MWDYILTFLVGAAIPIFTSWLQRKDERKKFALERKDKYKLVAIEKRLEAHQQAYYHWHQLRNIIHEKDESKRDKVLKMTLEFWLKNNLYLEYTTRSDFIETWFRVQHYPLFWDMWQQEEKGPEKDKYSNELKEHWTYINKLGDVIQRDVELEPIKMEINDSPMWEEK